MVRKLIGLHALILAWEVWNGLAFAQEVAKTALPMPPVPSAEAKVKEGEKSADSGGKDFTTSPQAVDKVIDEIKGGKDETAEKPREVVTPPTDFDYSNSSVKLESKKVGKVKQSADQALSAKMVEDLFKSVAEKDSRAINAYFSLDFSPDITNAAGETLLSHSIRSGNGAVASELLLRGADINKMSQDGSTPLMVAINSHNPAILNVLDRQKLDSFAKFENGTNYLMKAALSGNEDAVIMLLARGVKATDVDADGKSALHYAASGASGGIITALVNRAANVNLRDANGYTPLMLAAYAKNRPAVEALLGLGADPRMVDKFGRDASVHALVAGDAQLASMLGQAQVAR